MTNPWWTWWPDLQTWWGTVGSEFRFWLLLPGAVALSGWLVDGRDRGHE